MQLVGRAKGGDGEGEWEMGRMAGSCRGEISVAGNSINKQTIKHAK